MRSVVYVGGLALVFAMFVSAGNAVRGAVGG